MKTISSDYLIHPETMALIPSRQITCETLILEKEKEVYVNSSAFHLIQTSCLENYSTYEGRKQAMIYHTSFKRKVPILIGPNQIMFPTHAVNHIDCSWISSQHIYDITPHSPDSKSSIVLFMNGTEITLPVSTYILKSQMQRAEYCRQIIDKHDFNLESPIM